MIHCGQETIPGAVGNPPLQCVPRSKGDRVDENVEPSPLCRDRLEYCPIDFVVAEGLLVSLQPKPLQPAPDVHHVIPALVFGA
jgi:hypothetical protein